MILKQTATVVAMLLTICTFAQNIPNGNFENWETRDHFKLNGWYSPTKNVEQTTDAKEGNFALKLINTYEEGKNGSRGYIRTLDYDNKDKINGLAASGDALSIAFWCKYDLAVGDTARLYAVLREEGTYRGKVDFRFTGTSNDEYVQFKVPIEWSTAGSRQIDSIWLYLYSYVESKVDGDGYVIFDDIHFENIGQRQDDFYNNGFEEWTNTGLDFPKEWRSVDLLVYDTYTSFLNTESCTQESDSPFLGNSSLVIQNYMSGTKVKYGYAFIGTENNDYYTPHFPFTDTFRYLQGYYKYLPDGEDTARIRFRTWQNGSSRSNNNLYLHEPKNEWTFFSLPLTYDASKYKPDSAALICWSTYTDSIHGANTSLYIDNLELVMEPKPLKLSVKENVSNFSIYPNPAHQFLYLNLSTHVGSGNRSYRAINALGQKFELEVTKTAGQHILDVSHLHPSVYYVLVKDASTYSKSLKFIKK